MLGAVLAVAGARVGAVEARPVEGHAHDTEDFAELPAADRAHRERAVSEGLLDVECVVALGTTI
jgi:hypothetical protein